MIPGLTIASTNPTATEVSATLTNTYLDVVQSTSATISTSFTTGIATADGTYDGIAYQFSYALIDGNVVLYALQYNDLGEAYWLQLADSGLAYLIPYAELVLGLTEIYTETPNPAQIGIITLNTAPIPGNLLVLTVLNDMTHTSDEGHTEYSVTYSVPGFTNIFQEDLGLNYCSGAVFTRVIQEGDGVQWTISTTTENEYDRWFVLSEVAGDVTSDVVIQMGFGDGSTPVIDPPAGCLMIMNVDYGGGENGDLASGGFQFIASVDFQPYDYTILATDGDFNDYQPVCIAMGGYGTILPASAIREDIVGAEGFYGGAGTVANPIGAYLLVTIPGVVSPGDLSCQNTNLWNMNSDICSATVMPQGIAQQYASLSSLSNPSDPTLQLLMPDPSFFLSLPNFPPLPAFPISIDTSSSSVNMPPGPIDLPLGPNQNLQSYIEGLPGNAAINSTQASTVAGNIGWILGLNIPNNSTASGLFTAMKDALVSDAIGGVSGGIQTLYSLYSTLLSLSPLGSLKGSGLDLNTYLLKGMPTLNLTGISQAMQQSVAQKSSAPIMNFLQSATIIFLPFMSEATHTNMAQAFEDMLNAGITNKFYTADLANQMYDAFLGALSALQGFDYQMITEPEQAGTPVLASAQAYSAQMQALIGSVMISLIVPTMASDGSQGLLTPAQVVTALNALRDAINAARATNMESMIESLEIVAKECGPLE